mmetsp:Transcript_59871/g.129791  ORF Transcript_59871/g.129791 Transcript_59871/m.129791 type:complete len:249 (+) Transcript_59871:1122-1868(+)
MQQDNDIFHVRLNSKEREKHQGHEHSGYAGGAAVCNQVANSWAGLDVPFPPGLSIGDAQRYDQHQRPTANEDVARGRKHHDELFVAEKPGTEHGVGVQVHDRQARVQQAAEERQIPGTQGYQFRIGRILILLLSHGIKDLPGVFEILEACDELMGFIPAPTPSSAVSEPELLEDFVADRRLDLAAVSVSQEGLVDHHSLRRVRRKTCESLRRRVRRPLESPGKVPALMAEAAGQSGRCSLNGLRRLPK